MSISPDPSRIVITRPRGVYGSLEIEEVSTGSCLAKIDTMDVMRPHFTRDGREVWAGNYNPDDGEECEIVEDSESGAIELKLRNVYGWQQSSDFL